jgi:ABC-type antimicrobial peptide transport system permease subunit
VLGLAISLAGVTVISRYVYGELSADSFNSRLDRLYVVKTETLDNGKQFFAGSYLPREMHNHIDLLNHSGVERCASMICFDGIEIRANDYTYIADIAVIDSVFMQILDFPLISGVNISRPEDALITEAFARKIFGDKYPVGEKIYHPALNRELTVAGVVGKPDSKSSIAFDIAISNQISEFWGRAYQCIVLLHEGVNFTDINRQYGEYKQERGRVSKMRYQLFPYRDVYFDRTVDIYSVYGHGNRMYVFIMSIAGALLLLTGTVNYMNIHAVIVRRRSREFGMKKVFGAGGIHIFMQLLWENLTVIAASVIIALWLAESLSPVITDSLQIEQITNRLFDAVFLTALILVLPLTASVAPYLRYRFSTVKSLQTVGTGNRSPFSGKFFLCFQYFITVVMTVISLFFVKQLNFMLDYDLGYRTENIIKVPVRRDGMAGVSVERVRQSDEEAAADWMKFMETTQKLDNSPLIERWTLAGTSPNIDTYTVSIKVADGREQEAVALSVDKKWLDIFDIRLVDGSMWDDDDGNAILVSESFLKQFGIADYKTAVPEVRAWGARYHIVGVIKDFCTARLSEKQYPVLIYSQGNFTGDRIIASFLPGKKREVIEFMRNLYGEFVGGEFAYSFIEDEIADTYKHDKRIAVICSIFTGTAIVISSLGLFGLSLFDIRRRRREIAIRKINGAQITDIVRLLMKKYFILLGLAFAVATPAALFVISKYLENFAYKAPVSWWLFAVALTVTVAVSLITLIWQTYKAGNENPANVIKS